MKYRKKPVVVEAIQWTGQNLEAVSAFTCIPQENLGHIGLQGTWAVVSLYQTVSSPLQRGPEQIADGRLIIYQQNGGHQSAPSFPAEVTAGMQNPTVLPCFELLWAQRLPWCLSKIDCVIARPRPQPSGFRSRAEEAR